MVFLQINTRNITNTVLSVAKEMIRALRLVFRNTPGWTTANTFLILLLGLLPLVSLYIIKMLVDTVTNGIYFIRQDGGHS